MHGFIFCISSEKKCDYDFTSALDNAAGNSIDYYSPITATECKEAITNWLIKPAKGVLEYEGNGIVRVAKDPSTLAADWADSIRRQAEHITYRSIGSFSNTLRLEQALCHPLGYSVRFVFDECGCVENSRIFMLEVINAPIGRRFYIHEIYDFHF